LFFVDEAVGNFWLEAIEADASIKVEVVFVQR
jgi:hypothetical protein